MRITSGQCSGIPIMAPKGNATRPTTDKVRQSLFNILRHADYFDGFDSAQVLDSYCGTGALGLEALSNGAEFCYFCDKSKDALKFTQTNVEKCNMENRARILRHDSTKAFDWGRREFDLVFLDPPYGRNFGQATMENLLASEVLNGGSLIILEHEIKRPDIIPPEFKVVDERDYGQTRMSFVMLK